MTGVRIKGVIVLTALALSLHAATAAPLEATDLVFVTENNARIQEQPAGCDTISVFSSGPSSVQQRADFPIFTGLQESSPGRLAATSDLHTVIAMSAAHWPFLTWIWRTGASFEEWATVEQVVRVPDDERFSNSTAVTILDDRDTVLLSSSSGIRGSRSHPYGPYFLERYLLSEVYRDRRFNNNLVLAEPTGRVEISGLAAEIVHDLRDPDLVHVLSHLDVLHTIRISTMEEEGAAVPLALVARRSEDERPALGSLGVGHADITADGRHVVTNRWYARELNVIDLQGRASWTVPVPGLSALRVGGVALNKAAGREGQLAIHGSDELGVFDFAAGPPSRLVLRSQHPITPISPWGLDLRRPILWRDGGPVTSIAWSGSGERLIAGGKFSGPAEFGVYEVREDGSEIALMKEVRVCGDPVEYPLDILTINARITPVLSPTPTSTATPSSTPTATATRTLTPSPAPSRTPTAAPSPTGTSRPSATPVPAPIYLPLALTESCDPRQVRIDVALVIDASSSMREPAAPGSAKTKLQAAREAVGSFLDLLALDEGDQAAIVSFHGDARLHAPLTADRAALGLALAAVETGQQTRIDLGLEAATAALLDDGARDPDNEPVLVLLTDGRANPVPVAVALERAAEAKDEGITLFTIGLGDDVEAEALRAMASEPAFFLRAPTADELDGAYREVARSIPCPPSAYWGGG